MVEGASDGARRLVILMHISFSPLLQGARRCAWRRRREGQRLSSGEAGAAGDATGQCLCSVPPPPKLIKWVWRCGWGSLLNCPRPAAWLSRAYLGAACIERSAEVGGGGCRRIAEASAAESVAEIGAGRRSWGWRGGVRR